MSKKNNKIRVNFCGKNAEEVTGSCTNIISSENEILLECGLYQSNDPKADYKINSSKFSFKPKNIDYVFIGHAHIDHSGLCPRLFHEGFEGKVIVPRGNKNLLDILWRDSAYIIERDCEMLNKAHHMKTSPFYNHSDVDKALDNIVEYDIGSKFDLSDRISFRFTPSGHMLNAAQIELWITEGNQTKKILYTSDLGSSIPKYYTNVFEPVDKANIAICETTYADAARQVKTYDREKDLEKIRTIVNDVCLQKHGKILFPTFSMDRTQNMLTFLYEMFGNDSSFKVPILIDSPLAVKITAAYLRLLPDEERRRLEIALSWENVHIVKTYEESLKYQKCGYPVIALAASGFMQAGRSRSWAKHILPDRNSQIVFIGFATPNSLAGKLRSIKTKSITIDGKRYANRCGITTLHSFSSHIQHDDMLKYYSNIQCEKICLVHGDYKEKCEFSKELQEEISKKNKTSKVIVANKSTSLLI